MVLDPAPKNPSPRRAARRSAFGLPPPNQIGGPGFWKGLGSMTAPCNCQNLPSNSTLGSRHSARITSMPSVNRVSSPSGAMPNADNARPLPP
jgi:hypothetical protein